MKPAVLLVALPILPWARLRQRPAQLAGVGLATCMAAAIVADYWAYAEADWQYFRDLNLARGAFTDFGAAQKLLAGPDIMAQYGMSANDVTLVEYWFFVDKALAGPQILQGLLKDISFLSASSVSAAGGSSQ